MSSNIIELNRDKLIKLNKQYQELANLSDDEINEYAENWTLIEGRDCSLQKAKRRINEMKKEIKSKMELIIKPLQ